MKLMKSLMATAAGIGLAASVTASATAETWDMPMAYSATNFHSVTGAEFGKCVTTGTGGKSKSSPIPPVRSLRATISSVRFRPGRPRSASVFSPRHQNENAVFGVDSVPFLATSFEDAPKSSGKQPGRNSRSS